VSSQIFLQVDVVAHGAQIATETAAVNTHVGGFGRPDCTKTSGREPVGHSPWPLGVSIRSPALASPSSSLLGFLRSPDFVLAPGLLTGLAVGLDPAHQEHVQDALKPLGRLLLQASGSHDRNEESRHEGAENTFRLLIQCVNAHSYTAETAPRGLPVLHSAADRLCTVYGMLLHIFLHLSLLTWLLQYLHRKSHLFPVPMPLVTLRVQYQQRLHRASTTFIKRATCVAVHAFDWASSRDELFAKALHKGSGRPNVLDGKRRLLYKSVCEMQRGRWWLRPSELTQPDVSHDCKRGAACLPSVVVILSGRSLLDRPSLDDKDQVHTSVSLQVCGRAGDRPS